MKAPPALPIHPHDVKCGADVTGPYVQFIFPLCVSFSKYSQMALLSFAGMVFLENGLRKALSVRLPLWASFFLFVLDPNDAF